MLLIVAGAGAASLSISPQRSEAAEARALAAINLWSGPGWDHRIILTIPAGANIKVTGSYNKGFYPIRYQGTKGWVDASYVSTHGGKISPLGPVRTTESLNLRSSPGTNYRVKLIMPAGASLKITGSYRHGFYPVRYQGINGWASAEHLVPGRPLPTWSEEEIIGILYAAAAEFGLNGAEMVRIARCESNLDPYNVTPPHSATGLFQFLPSTWASTPYARDNIFDPALNAQAAAWMWTHGRRNEWECG